MTISTKLAKLIGPTPAGEMESVQSPDSPEEALEKLGQNEAIYAHNGKIYSVRKVKGGRRRYNLDTVKINELKGNPAALVFLKTKLVGSVSTDLDLVSTYKTAASKRARSGALRGVAPPQRGSGFSSLYHKFSDVTIRPSKNSLKSPGGSPQLYAFITINIPDVDAFIDDGPAKSKSKTAQLTKNKLTAPPKDGEGSDSINTEAEGTSMSDTVAAAKAQRTSINEKTGEEVKELEILSPQELNDLAEGLLPEGEEGEDPPAAPDPHEIVKIITDEEMKKRATSIDESEPALSQKLDLDDRFKQILKSILRLDNVTVSTGVESAMSVLDYYIEVMEDNDPPIDPTNLKGINLIDEMEKIGKLKDYFEDLKEMNGLGTGPENKVVKMIQYYNFEGGLLDLENRLGNDFPGEGERADESPIITFVSDKSPFLQSTAATKLTGSEPAEPNVIRFNLDIGTDLGGSITEAIDKVCYYDSGFIGSGANNIPSRPPSQKHPAYDQLLNIDGKPQTFRQRGDEPEYSAENLPNRIIKEVDITKTVIQTDAYDTITDPTKSNLIYTVKYRDHEQMENHRFSEYLIREELEIANRIESSYKTIPRSLLEVYVYEKVKQPGNDDVTVLINSKTEPLGFTVETDLIISDTIDLFEEGQQERYLLLTNKEREARRYEALALARNGELTPEEERVLRGLDLTEEEFTELLDLRREVKKDGIKPIRFSGFGISEDISDEEDNNGKNVFPGYTPTTWSILKNLKEINEELPKISSGGATPWTEFLPKVFTPAVEFTPKDIDDLCKNGEVERAEQIHTTTTPRTSQDNNQSLPTAYDDPKIDKKAQKTRQEAKEDPSVSASKKKIRQSRKSELRASTEHAIVDAVVTCDAGFIKQMKDLNDILKLLGRFDFKTMLGELAKKLASDILLQQALLQLLLDEGLLPEDIAAEFARCGPNVDTLLDLLNRLMPDLFNALDDIDIPAFDGLNFSLDFTLPTLNLPLIPNLDIYGFIRMLMVQGIKAALIKILAEILKEAIQELLGCNGDSLLDSLIAKAAEGLNLDIDADLFGNLKDALNLANLLPPGFNSEDGFGSIFEGITEEKIFAFYDALSAALTGNEMRSLIYDTPTSGRIYRTARDEADRIFGTIGETSVLTDAQLKSFFLLLREIIPRARFEALIPIREGAVICDEGALNGAANQIKENAEAMGMSLADLAKQFIDALCGSAEEANDLANLLKPGGLENALTDAVNEVLENTPAPDEVMKVLDQAAAVVSTASTTLILESEVIKQYLSGVKTKGPSMPGEFKFAAFKPNDFDQVGDDSVPKDRFKIIGTEDDRQELRAKLGNESNIVYDLDSDTFVKSLTEDMDLVLQSSNVTLTSGVFTIYNKLGDSFKTIAQASIEEGGTFTYSDRVDENGQNLLRQNLGDRMQEIISATPFQKDGNVNDKFAYGLAYYTPSGDNENYSTDYRNDIIKTMDVKTAIEAMSDACMDVMPKNIMAGPIGLLEKDKCVGAAQIVFSEVLRFYFAVSHYINQRTIEPIYYLSDKEPILLQLVVDYLSRKIRKDISAEVLGLVEKIADSMEYGNDKVPNKTTTTEQDGTKNVFDVDPESKFIRRGEPLIVDDKIKLFIYKCLSYFQSDPEKKGGALTSDGNLNQARRNSYFPNGFNDETPLDSEIQNYVIPVQPIVAMQIIWASEYDLPGALGLKFEDFLNNATSLYRDAKAKLDQNTNGN